MTRSWQKTWWIAVTLLGIVCVSFGLLLFIDRYVRSRSSAKAPAAITAQAIGQIYYAVLELERRGVNLTDKLRTGGGKRDFNQRLSELLTEQGLLGGVKEVRMKDGLLVDAWGRPFLVRLRNTQKGGDTPDSQISPPSVLVWSAGSNGINEDGQGDDINGPRFLDDFSRERTKSKVNDSDVPHR